MKIENFNLVVYKREDGAFSSFICPLELDIQGVFENMEVLSIKALTIKNLTNKQGKYKSIKCEDREGRVFDSKTELVVYHEFEIYEELGYVKEMDRQIPFSFAKFNIRSTYRPDLMFECVKDFSVYSQRKNREYKKGQTYVGDVKSPGTRRDPVYSYKKGLMKTFWGFEVSEIVRRYVIVKTVNALKRV